MVEHMAKHPQDVLGSRPTKAGWRVGEWTKDTGLSRATTYNLLNEGKIRSVKSGSARIILTSPSQYLESLAGKTG